MAAGLPLVGTRVGGLPELVEEGSNGRLVPPGDPQALAAAICSVLEDPDRARRWGSASRARVESEFHCDRMVRAYEELFVRLLGEARVRVAAGGA
jgi:glycosyltransferase involved in cell wall biosynthesis